MTKGNLKEEISLPFSFFASLERTRKCSRQAARKKQCLANDTMSAWRKSFRTFTPAMIQLVLEDANPARLGMSSRPATFFKIRFPFAAFAVAFGG
jgi:hypothetical protein